MAVAYPRCARARHTWFLSSREQQHFFILFFGMSSADVSEPSVEVARTPSELSAIAQAQAGQAPFFGTLTHDGYCNIWFAGSSHCDWLAMIAYMETKFAISGRQPTSKEKEKLRSWRHNYQSVVSRAAVSAAKKPKPASKRTKGLKPAPAESRPVATSSMSAPVHLGTVSGADSSNSRKRSVGDSAEEEPPASEQYRVDEGSAASSSGGPVPGGEADCDAQPRSQRTKRAKTMFDPDDPPTKGDYTSASRVGPSVVVAPPTAAMAASDGPDGAVLPAVQLSAPVAVGSSSSSAGANVPAIALAPAVVPPAFAPPAVSSKFVADDDLVVQADVAHFTARHNLASSIDTITALGNDAARMLRDASLRADQLLVDARASADGVVSAANLRADQLLVAARASADGIISAANAEADRLLRTAEASGRAVRASTMVDCQRRLVGCAEILHELATEVCTTRSALDERLYTLRRE